MSDRFLARVLYAIGAVFTLGCAVFMIAGIIRTERSTSIRFPLVQYVPIAVLLLSAVGFGCRIHISLRMEREEWNKKYPRADLRKDP